MKVTTKMFYDGFITGMQNNMEAILNDNEKISTSKNINRPSDDPTAMSRIVNYKTNISSLESYKKAIDMARSPLEATESAYNNLNTAISRANELAVGGANGTMDPGSRLMNANEIGVILDTVTGIANTKVGDRYIFSGYQSDVPPINAKTGEFVTDSNAMNIDISASVKIALNIPGSDLFSFKRVNPNDSDGSVLPSYNWDPTGAYSSSDNIYEDADPNGALYTSKPDTFYLNSTNNTIKIDGANYDIDPFVVNNSNNTIRIDGTDYTIANGTYSGRVLLPLFKMLMAD